MLWIRTLLVFAMLFGHGAFWVACFNRINATGIHRVTIKRVEKIFVGLCLILPCVIWFFDGREIMAWCWQPSTVERLLDDHFQRISLPTQYYAIFCLLALAILLPLFIHARFEQRRSPRYCKKLLSHVHNVSLMTTQDIFGATLARTLAQIPGNQIGWIEYAEKEIRLKNMPIEFDGLRVLHFSDLHLTGEMSKAFYQAVLGLVTDTDPDLCVLSGDIIDYEEYLDWIPELVSDVRPRFGKYFLLGNHDRRIAHPDRLRDLMESIGWQDVGRQRFAVEIGGKRLEIIGNEQPWFPLNPSTLIGNVGLDDSTSDLEQPDLEIAVAHSPDQFAWAVMEQSQLLLTGHTHGGQVRLPFLGPLVAPSWHGSRYASGVFRRGNTTMHVTRGIGGVHPLRFNCLPEICTLVLKSDA